MEINKTIKTEEGYVTFNGILTDDEHDFLIEYALNSLLMQGALPFKMSKDLSNIVPGSNEVQ